MASSTEAPIDIGTIVTRQPLCACVCASLRWLVLARGVDACALDRMIFERGLPNAITYDNGTEFTSRHFDAWEYERRITLDFIRPGRPVEIGTIESFNGQLREECLSQYWFESLAEARDILQAWRTDYNEVRPHSSLENRTPKEVAERVLSWAAD